MTKTTTATDRLPVRVQRLLDLATKYGLAVEPMEDQAGRCYRSRAWAVRLGERWYDSRVLIHWMRFNDAKGPGRVSLTWISGSGERMRKIPLKSAAIWMKPL